MRDKITEVSIALFERNGFRETSIQDICDALGVTKGTFYYYFTSKEELLMDIHRQYIEDILAQQEAILANDASTCRQKLHGIVAMLIHDIEVQGNSARVFFREMRQLNEERLALIVPKRHQFRINVENLLQNGIQTGEFRSDLNVKIAAFAILGIANWSYQWFQPSGSISGPELSNMFVEMILQGIDARS